VWYDVTVGSIDWYCVCDIVLLLITCCVLLLMSIIVYYSYCGIIVCVCVCVCVCSDVLYYDGVLLCVVSILLLAHWWVLLVLMILYLGWHWYVADALCPILRYYILLTWYILCVIIVIQMHLLVHFYWNVHGVCYGIEDWWVLVVMMTCPQYWWYCFDTWWQW
jgi:hypothetical protein